MEEEVEVEEEREREREWRFLASGGVCLGIAACQSSSHGRPDVF